MPDISLMPLRALNPGFQDIGDNGGQLIIAFFISMASRIQPLVPVIASGVWWDSRAD